MIFFCDLPTPPEMEEPSPTDWRSLRAIVLHRDMYRCYECGDEATEVDHLWPRSKGGSDKLSNLAAICRPCNAGKGDRIELRRVTTDRLADASAALLNQALDAIRSAARWDRLREALMGEELPVTVERMDELADGSLADNDRSLANAISRITETFELSGEVVA